MNKETRNLFHREDKWRTWDIYKHHKRNNPKGKLEEKYNQDNSNDETDGFKISHS